MTGIQKEGKKTFSDKCIMENMYQFKRWKKENGLENDPKRTQVECHLETKKNRMYTSLHSIRIRMGYQ